MVDLMQILKRRYLRIFAGSVERKRWAGGISGKHAIKVFYGHEDIPDRNEIAQGGIVKYQDLSSRFPNTIAGANLVYLVSSAPPPAIGPLIRAARKAGAKIVLNQNGVAYPAWHGAGWRKVNKPMKTLMGIADYVVYQSSFCKISADRYLGPCSGQWEILHNPVDTRTFVPGPKLAICNGPVLLASGSHRQLYRIESVIRTFALIVKKYPSARLRIAGHLGWKPTEEEARKEVLKICDELGVTSKVAITGRYTQTEVVSLLQSAHILIHTKYNDPCPRMVVEAMACGLPVIYSNSGGTPELVGNDAGVGVEVPQGWERLHSPSPEDIAEAVGVVVNNYDAASRAARQRAVSRFDTIPWLDRHEHIFKTLLA